MSNENLYRDTATPEPALAPASEGAVLLNEIATLHGTLGTLRQMVAGGLLGLSQRVVALEEQDKADRAERQARQAHLDRLLWAGLALGGAHLLLDAARLWRGRS